MRGLLGLVGLVSIGCRASPSRLDKHDAGAGGDAGPDRAVHLAVSDTAKHAIYLDEPRLDLPKLESFALIKPGTGARALLRYQLAAGTVEFHAETQLSSRHLDHGAFTPPVKLGIRDGFAVTVTADHPTELALRPLDGEIAGPTTPEAEQYLATWRALVQNRRSSLAFDPRGAVSAITFKDDPSGARSAAAKDELAQRLLATAVPVPAEPVGLGAVWTVVTILRQGPVAVKQTATYTLLERTPRGWKLHAKLARVGEQQVVEDPSLPSGVTTELIAMVRTLEGDIDVDPQRALIAAGTLTVDSRLHLRIEPSGQTPTEQILEDEGTVTLSSVVP